MGKVIAIESTDGGQVNSAPIQLARKTDPREGNFRISALKGSFKISWDFLLRVLNQDRTNVSRLLPTAHLRRSCPEVLDFKPTSVRSKQGASTITAVPLDRRELTLLTSPEVAIRGTVTGWDGKPAQGVSMFLTVAIGNEKGNILQTALGCIHGRPGPLFPDRHSTWAL